MTDETNTAEQIAYNLGWAVLDAADNDRDGDGQIDIERWRHHIGPLRRALRLVRIDAPKAATLISWLESRIDIYASRAAWAAQQAMDSHEIRWNANHTEYTTHRTIETTTGLDTGVLHGPAGRDIRWGCHPLPRFDHS